MFVISILLILSTSNAFYSSYGSYNMFKFTERPEDDKLYKSNTGQELFDRNKCATCCKVMFVSDYNPITKAQFTPEDDKNGHIRYTMDMEFDDKRNVRDPNNYNKFYDEYNGYQQHVVLRPMSMEEPLQYFEFGEYDMYNPYLIPRRVFDIQGGVHEGRALILYMNKWGNEDGNGVKNQQFKYVHDYKKLGYYDKIQQDWKNYPGHFFLPNTTKEMLCFSFEDRTWGTRVSTNTGNKNLLLLWHDDEDISDKLRKLSSEGYDVNIEKGYQIISRNCDKDDAKQMFVPIFI